MKKTIILGILFLSCMLHAWAQNNEYIPYLTEGVKFVNEKVVVDHGDTTSIFYSYEIEAVKDTVLLDPIYAPNDTLFQDNYNIKYTLMTNRDSNDSIICKICGEKSTFWGDFWVFDNLAYWQLEEEGRCLTHSIMYMCPGYELLDCLYDYTNPLDGVYGALGRYVYCQYDWTDPDPVGKTILKEDRFVEYDSVLIDGMQMQRIAYLDDSGEPMAFIVQGIGFDSRDMGDLITPFIRLPEPDADYQEWWGLSHVVKDGRIIYKGMRYRDGVTTGIDEVVADQPQRPLDPHYYNLMGQPVGTEVPTAPGIYIHQGKKIIVR